MLNQFQIQIKMAVPSNDLIKKGKFQLQTSSYLLEKRKKRKKTSSLTWITNSPSWNELYT